MPRLSLSFAVVASLLLPGAAFAKPPELEAALETLIEAANARQLDGVINQFAPDFRHEDGLTLEDTRLAIRDLWARHAELNYSAVIDRWDEAERTAVITTTLSGLTTTGYRLEGELIVENQYNNKWYIQSQVVRSEVLQLSTGEAPPSLTLNVPTAVRLGEIYDIEAILEEPIGDRLVLGAIIEQQVAPSAYREVSTVFPLEPLRAGGIFRRAEAPFLPDSLWLGVMLVSNGGITIQEQRLRALTGVQLEALQRSESASSIDPCQYPCQRRSRG